MPVTVDEKEQEAAGESLHIWEAALLRRVRQSKLCSQHSRPKHVYCSMGPSCAQSVRK